MSAHDYAVDASAVGCCRGAHVWDSPDGFVPEDGRQVTCRVCPATARAKAEGHVERLLRRVLPESADLAAKAVIEAALREAIDVTHEVGTEEETDAAALRTFWDAIRAAQLAPHTPSPEEPKAQGPDCECGHTEAEHLEPYGFSVSRACAADGGCDCRYYSPPDATEPECNCGDHECGGCYPP